MSVLLSPASGASLADERASLRRHWGLHLALGLVSVVVGLLAIGSPQIATTKLVIFLGVLLLIAGGAEIAHALLVRNLRGFALHLLAAALYLIVGLFILEDSERAAAVLTLLLAAAFFVGGLLRIVFSVALRFPAWPWVLLNGVVNLFLGALIMRGWPASGLWVIGLFVGIDLLFHGWTWIVQALAVRTYSPASSA
jgi:uncharacterized membrane protein HdeD (DUF308 family)